ncbi:MAG: hypothetical protein J0H08_12555 [Rhizobiales bacterium]|nr:hypothetical protein [Hyphomicrobiales bacterium]
MNTFRWIAVIVAMIMGLGIARLLISTVGIFRARRRAKLDWLPLVWAATIFLQEVAFWWSLEEAASRVEVWTLPSFLMLVALVLALFMAAALILPFNELEKGESLRTFFEEDGRWALVALAVFNLAIGVLNFRRGGGHLSEQVVLNAVFASMALAAFLGPRSIQVLASLACPPIIVWGVVRLTS